MAGWFNLQARLSEAEATIVRLRADLDDAGESYQGVSQQRHDAEARVKQMTIMRDPATVDKAALRIAKEIEDLFVRGSPDGRSQRLAQMQVAIIGAVQDAIKGGRDYDLGWRKAQDES